jgi:Uma2 family endonuclease
MSRILSITDNHIPPPLIINVEGLLTGEQFEELCRLNRDLRLELTSTGELIAMPPTGSKMGIRNANLTHQLTAWAELDQTGLSFDSSTLFALPNGARYWPDAAWIKSERWERLTEEEQERIAPICPDFVVEIRSRSDNLPPLQSKMHEYLENGASMAWIVDPLRRLVYVYSRNKEVEILDEPEFVSGEPLLPGFRLEMGRIW